MTKVEIEALRLCVADAERAVRDLSGSLAFIREHVGAPIYCDSTVEGALVLVGGHLDWARFNLAIAERDLLAAQGIAEKMLDPAMRLSAFGRISKHNKELVAEAERRPLNQPHDLDIDGGLNLMFGRGAK